MKIDLEGDNLKGSLLGLVIAIVEILHETLEHQALRRMEGESLSEAQIERLGNSLMRLKETIEELKEALVQDYSKEAERENSHSDSEDEVEETEEEL